MPARSNKSNRKTPPQPSRLPQPSKSSTQPRRPSRLDIASPPPASPPPDIRTPKKPARAKWTDVTEALSAPEATPHRDDEGDSSEVARFPKKNLQRVHQRTRREQEQSKTPTPRAEGDAKPMSLLDAAALLLGRLSSKELAQGLSATHLLDRIVTERLWRPGKGRTPHMTLYSGMNRESMVRGNESRFKRIGPNLFTAGPALKRGTRSAKSDERSVPPKPARSRDKKSTRENKA